MIFSTTRCINEVNLALPKRLLRRLIAQHVYDLAPLCLLGNARRYAPDKLFSLRFGWLCLLLHK